jgi:hypothetical protein
LPGTTGSGFYLKANNVIYLVTARHVLYEIDPTTKKMKLHDGPLVALSYSKDKTDSKRNILNLNLATLNSAGNIKSHASEDVAVIKIAMIIPGQPQLDSPQQPRIEQLPQPNEPPKAQQPQKLSLFSGITLQEMTASGFVGADVPDTVRTFDQVGVGNEVVMFGYPR